MKTLKTILIFSIAIFGAGFLFVSSAKAVDPLVVEFETTPLFSEANFLPGGEITSWARVTNTSGATQRIATQPLNITDLNRLGDVLNLVIKEGDKTLYNNALSNFFANGEVYLSDLANGINTQYDFTVSFYSGTQNTFQGKTLKFDILVGFQGTEGGLLPGAGSSSGGGGGGGLPPGLTIINETAISATQTTVIITWMTSYAATSQVIYGTASEKHILDLTDTTGSPPKYGYEYTTSESDISPKVTFHTATITGLTSGTTYYFRAVSHASLAISQEHSFTTLATKEEAGRGGTSEEEISGLSEGAGNEITGQSNVSQSGTPKIIGKEETKILAEAAQGVSAETEKKEGQIETKTSAQGLFGNFFATIGAMGWRGWLILLIIVLVILVLLFILRKRRKEKESGKQIL